MDSHLKSSEHPITPPLELRQLWAQQAQNLLNPYDPAAWQEYIATQAARWGDGQRLEACCEWLREARHHGLGDEVGAMLADRLRAAMRPSLAEQGQRILVENGRTLDGRVELDPEDVVIISAALERLQQLEQENNG